MLMFDCRRGRTGNTDDDIIKTLKEKFTLFLSTKEKQPFKVQEDTKEANMAQIRRSSHSSYIQDYTEHILISNKYEAFLKRLKVAGKTFFWFTMSEIQSECLTFVIMS